MLGVREEDGDAEVKPLMKRTKEVGDEVARKMVLI